MECALALLDSDRQSLLEGLQTTVIWQLEIVDAGHDTGEVIVGRVGWFAGATHHSEDRCKALETWR